MSHFNLQINKLNAVLASFEVKRQTYEEQLRHFYEFLNNVDSVWNDNNVNVFKSKLSEDKKKILDYLFSLNLLSNKLKNFNDELIKILSTYGFSDNIGLFKFDDSYFNDCFNKLSDVTSILNNARHIIYKQNFDLDASENTKYALLKKQIDDSIVKVTEIKQKYENFVKEIMNLLSDYNECITYIGGLDIEMKLLDLNVKFVSLSEIHKF